MYVLRCNFYDLDVDVNIASPDFVDFITWVKNNNDVFTDLFIGSSVVYNKVRVGEVLSVNLETKKYLANIDRNLFAKSEFEHLSIDCTVDLIEGKYSFEIVVRRNAFLSSLPMPIYENQYEYLLNREIGE